MAKLSAECKCNIALLQQRENNLRDFNQNEVFNDLIIIQKLLISMNAFAYTFEVFCKMR